MITVKNLWFSYTPGGSYLLKDMNLSIKDGDYISILGDNGSGKSTFIKLLLNMLIPTQGTIDNDFMRPAYVPQRFENLNTQFPITVYEVLNCYRKAVKVKEKDCIERSLELVGMNDFRHSLIGTLSGGQCQKVFIARALLGNPDVIFLDEPSNGVDPKSQIEIYKLIKQINLSHNATVISVEHNLQAATNNSSAIYHIVDGVGHLCSPDHTMYESLPANLAGIRRDDCASI